MPKCRGASWKFSRSTLTTTAWFVCTSPLRGETIETSGSPGVASTAAWALVASLLPPKTIAAATAAPVSTSAARVAFLSRIGKER